MRGGIPSWHLIFRVSEALRETSVNMTYRHPSAGGEISTDGKKKRLLLVVSLLIIIIIIIIIITIISNFHFVYKCGS